MITRRGLLAGGLAVGALAVAGAINELRSPRLRIDEQHRYAFLTDDDRVVVAAIAPVMLGVPDVLPYVVRGADTAISQLPLVVRKDLRSLFGLLENPAARILVAGVVQPWPIASHDEIAHFLQSWRTSPIAKLRAAYDAMHLLINAAWYGQERSWAAIGYPGPPVLPR